MVKWQLAPLGTVVLAIACGDVDPRDPDMVTGLGGGISLNDDDGEDGASTTAGEASGDSDTSGGDPNDADDAGDDDAADGGAPKLDVAGDDGPPVPCDPSDICCLEAGELPPHILLDAFIDAYPPELMPKSHDEVTSFSPEADGHMMAFNLDNVGNEFIDPSQGGVIEANIEAGRDYSKMFADAVLPPGSTVLSVREDPVTIENLAGGGTGCIGVGWGWGSVLFEPLDGSIQEVVYLYVGYCYEGDSEAFFYSDSSVQVCAPAA